MPLLPKKLPPIDLTSREWIVFDWVRMIVYRNIQLGIAKSSEQSMPLEYRHVKLRREDTGELIFEPLEYCHFPVCPKVTYIDVLFDAKVFAETRCSFVDNQE